MSSERRGLRRPVGLLVAGWVILFLATLGVAALLPDSGVPGVDRPVVVGIAHHRAGWLTSAMRFASTVGSPGYVLAAVAVAAAVLLVRREIRSAMFVLLVAYGADADDSLTKLVVQRRRPDLLRVAHEGVQGASFPSGHATIATAGVLAIAVALAQHLRGWARGSVLTVGGLAPLVVGFSRVYLGVHWPTDVLAGWLIGVGWLMLTIRAGFGSATVRQPVP